MMLQLVRDPSNSSCTLGRLSVDGDFECFTLEDVVREVPGEPVEKWKIPGQTAIPSGEYDVIVNESPHFQKLLPLLQEVPGFDGVRIHSGNVAADTEGCILVGQLEGTSNILNSHAAFDALFPKIQAALANGENVQIRITNTMVPAPSATAFV
jgi:Steigviridae/Suoliviridae L,D-carboxypeptidase/transpeptidase